MKALVAFLLDGDLPLDPFLRARVVRMASRNVVQDGLLRRFVNLPASRTGSYDCGASGTSFLCGDDPSLLPRGYPVVSFGID